MMKRSLRRRGIEQVDNKSNKRKQLSDILFFSTYSTNLYCMNIFFIILNLFFLSLRPALVFKLKDDDLQNDLEGMHIVSWFL